ncbi:MAG: N-acetyltransferase [Proteobacteria bacterium]|nr:N-acetyltransferase [Pseudomonadota bacterium]
MWLRTMQPESRGASFPHVKLAFVGNVATDKREQGKGWMKALLAEIERRALAQSADAIVLWSDLADFYQKLGFTPAGNELRLTLSTKKLCAGNGSTVWVPEGYQTGKLQQDLIRRIFELRSTGFKQPFFQVERSVHEFSELLRIPDLALFVGHGAASGTAGAADQRPIDFFFVVGKGADMQGVIHEWGCTDMTFLMGAAGFVAQKANLEEIMMLVPPAIEDSRLASLRQASTRIEEHAMAWVKVLKPENRPLVDRALRDGFIWGLDSI